MAPGEPSEAVRKALRAQEALNDLKAEMQSKKRRQHRNAWWTWSAQIQTVYDSVQQQESEVARRQLLMLRRATNEHYFSAAQAKQLVESIPIGSKKTAYHRVEALVVLFSRITDIENIFFDRLLGHTGYDQDGNHMVTVEELEAMQDEPFPLLCNRLGIGNLFNPLRPEREYALNLRKSDERAVCQCLVTLTAEPGENLMYETYNGIPFDVGQKWEIAVPELGMFCAVFNTPPRCGSLALRLPLAKKLLMGGRGRWKAVEEELRMEGENPEEFEDDDDDVEYIMDADGLLVSKESVETRLKALEATKAARAEAEKEAEAARQAAAEQQAA